MSQDDYRHWSEEIAQEAFERFDGSHIVCAGWSPSGIYHIGNSREAVTCHAINVALQDLGAKSNFIFVIDDYDPLDKIPSNLKQYSKKLRPYLGHPIAKIPDFTGETASYADYFIRNAVEAMEDFGIEVRFESAYQLYQDGNYDPFIHKYWSRRAAIDSLFEQITGSVLDTYISVICGNCGNIKTTSVVDITSQVISYTCRHNGMFRGCDYDGTTMIKDHYWKLKWRLDWPARQSFLGVTVEPSGKDHSVAGGSVDTAMAIHKHIFEVKPPLLERYGFITMKGKKFSGSKGGALAANRVSEIMPTSAYLFLIFRSDLLKDINFNPESMEYGNLLDEFDMAREMVMGNKRDYSNRQREFDKLTTAVELAMEDEEAGFLPANVKFNELSTVYQTSLKDVDVTLSKLDALGKIESKDAREDLKRRLLVLDNWLENMAPSSVIINFLDEIPENVENYWSNEIYDIWRTAIDQVDTNTTPEEFTEILRNKAKTYGIKPQKFYPPFYRLLTGKPRGPDASGLVLALGKDELLTRLNQLKELL